MTRVIYASKGGNTKKLAEAIARGAGVSAVPVAQITTLEPTDILFVGASIYAGSIDGVLRHFLEELTPEQVKTVAVFGSAARKNTVLPLIKAALAPSGIAVCEESFHCSGSFLFLNRGRPNEEDLQQAEAFAKRVCNT